MTSIGSASIRVELKANSRVLNAGQDKKENIAQLWHIHATKKEREGQVDMRGDGGYRGRHRSPRRRSRAIHSAMPKHPILLEKIEFPETVISMAIEPESTTERKKLGETLEMMKRQDPTFRADENEETGQTIISGMGELHLEVIKHRLLRDFNSGRQSPQAARQLSRDDRASRSRSRASAIARSAASSCSRA